MLVLRCSKSSKRSIVAHTFFVMLLSGAIANVSAVQVIVLTAVPVAVFFLVLHVWQQKSGKGKLPLPPTPPGKPILGNLPDFVSAAKQGTAHLLVEDWTRQYGDIIRVKLGPFTEYFLSSDVAVKQLIDKASAQTAGRPRWIVSNEQMCNKLNVLFLDGSDPRWKFQRKVIHSALTSIPRADAGIPFLHYETAKFLDEVLHDPDAGTASQELWAPIQRYTYSTFAAQTFGMEVPDSDDPVIHFVHETGLASILATLPGAHLVEILPFLEKLPMFMKPWEQSARARFRRDFQWTTERLHRAKKDIENGISHEAFLHQVLKDDKLLGFANEEEAAYLTLQLMLGAADTSQISTWSFLEAMMLFPEVQAKARQEIEAHVGDRMPVYEDLEQIPYVRCLMKEVWRWRPPVALGHPHTTTQELTYNGYRIPKVRTTSSVAFCNISCLSLVRFSRRRTPLTRLLVENRAPFFTSMLGPSATQPPATRILNNSSPNGGLAISRRRNNRSILLIPRSVITLPSAVAGVYALDTTLQNGASRLPSCGSYGPSTLSPPRGRRSY